jgi:hypothetical protein
VTALVRQRVYGLALGYEDLNGHDDLKRDPLSAVALDKSDVQGEARHREADRGKVLASLVQRIRARWPHTRIILRGDSGFARDALMDWCESHGIYYLLGLAQNKRLLQRIGKEFGDAHLRHLVTAVAARVFTAFDYRTQESWSRARHVIAKAEHLRKGANLRFIVTNLPDGCADPSALYEDHYCACGEMENRIKEQQLGLFADRTSTHHLSSDQLRLWFSTAAHTPINPLRRVLIHFAGACPYQPLFQTVWQRLQHCPLRR